MWTKPVPRMNLRRLIVLVAFASALVSLANTFYASYSVQRQLLIDTTLEANHAYASKLASTAEDFLQSARQQLAYSAGGLPSRMEDEQWLTDEAQRLRLQTNSFNSVLIVDAQGKVLGVSPETLALKHRTLDSAGAAQALRERRPLITQPYMSSAGNLVVFISHPIVGKDGRYLGYVGGSIYLKQKNILYTMLGQHYYRDGSYLYVVDQNRRLLYHPDPDRLGDVAGSNQVIDTIIAQRGAGNQRMSNSLGVDMLAGYAVMPSTGWGIVAQRPTAMTLAPLQQLMANTVWHSLPIALLSLPFIWWLASLISRPLVQLAEGARRMDAPGTAERIAAIRSWYVEAAQIKKALLKGLGLLQNKIGKLKFDVQTDPLTGLSNRRGMAAALDAWQAQARPFSVIAIDIDHFKQVNDRWGHAVGDEVILRLAQLMRACSRDADVLCRNGGDEFIMLLPDADLDVALQVAERLRARVAAAEIPGAGPVTVSLGVVSSEQAAGKAGGADAVLLAADAALYVAKENGRNRVGITEPA
ncbi:GGDEF domain-containing protein [Janthinobacterium sp. BJB1]|uniref:sensor domain-containing diguanylate cyclase n=1 Tax=Janthinobacterium sp. GW458P TaxID=1981504 RepID=UPI000A32899A|nr:sensor domain-containing diguanylate cyclase [Janthinobacterium sp. GW458P]MBE3025563.1 GGDEF domain-containing protein [Janthinobacterium sp. GW458P]PHV14371.1 GGDEF domain-containing protein [Janthinobacterium sp. BJB303]PJD00362.1 GGDEF domain-containing protein [Janthinobacterium sp. BJB1]